MSIDFKAEINRLKKDLDVTVVAHYYQRDEVFEMADITGDSLELARRCQANDNEWVVFCGVGFMGQSVRVIDQISVYLCLKSLVVPWHV